ncbi:MAG: hypothetical protein ACYCQJ_03270 [Nitrososphaerales archaeon]
MQQLHKIALVVALLVLVPSVTAYAVSVLTLNISSSVNVTLPPGLTMYAYNSSTQTCQSTTVSSISFSAYQGGSQTVDECLENTGGTTFFLTASSFSDTLASTVGSISITYYSTSSQALGSVDSVPITMGPATEIVSAFLLSIPSTSPVQQTSFNIAMQVFSTSSG